MKVRIKKLNKNAVIPSYAKQGDAGMDYTATRIIKEVGLQVTYGTDLAVEIPDGYVGLAFPRSSIRNYELELSNSVGVIDACYRGELQATFNKTNGYSSKIYNVGDRIFQLVIVPFPMVELEESEELSITDRGDGGFGHTGV